MPVTDTERALCARYGFSAIEVEAAVPDDIIPHVADCDAVFVVSAELAATRHRQSVEMPDHLARQWHRQDRCPARYREGNRGLQRPPLLPRRDVRSRDGDGAFAVAADRLDVALHARGSLSACQSRGSPAPPTRHSQALGIVGFGASGKAVARRARSFGMTVIATRRAMAGPHPEAEELGVEMVELTQLLERSDFLSLQLPLTRETYHLFDR